MIKSSLSVFANELATGIAKRYPASLDSLPGKRPSVNRLTKIIEDTCAKAKNFNSEKKLGWIKKAFLVNEFKWALKNLGYQDDFVSFATEAVMVNLSKKVEAVTPKA